jgi:hypothetical protein
MTKIHPDTSTHYRLPIDGRVNIDQLSEYIQNIPPHPSILSPFNIIKEDGVWYFLYKVETNGMTLRNWINPTNTHKSSFVRKTIFVRRRKMHNLDIMLNLIDTYEFMLSNNISFGQSNINPDLIWVEYDASHNIHFRVLNTLESMAYGCGSTDKNYWSPELIGKYNHVNYYDTAETTAVTKQKSLKRYNTRPSTLSSVYSLGLILYFLTYKDDPFTELRLDPYDRPTESANGNGRISALIRSATTPDIKERPTMQEWKTQIIDSRKKTNMVCDFLQSMFS